MADSTLKSYTCLHFGPTKAFLSLQRHAIHNSAISCVSVMPFALLAYFLNCVVVAEYGFVVTHAKYE